MPDLILPPQPSFIDLVSRLLNQRLQEFATGEVSLDGNALLKIHKVIKEGVYDICQKCNFTLDDISKRYMAQLLFKSLNVHSQTGEVDLESHYMMNEIEIGDISSPDLRIIHGLFGDSDWEQEIREELHRRS
jgi:hypothetical protein